MKKRSLLFVVLAAVGLALLPLYNLLLAPTPLRAGEDGWTRARAFRLDPLLPHVNRVLYALGISSDPGQAIPGKDGWLFLGDRHRGSVTHRRVGALGVDLAPARAVAGATRAWNDWYGGQGVRAYRVLICADKESIYPDYLPDWARAQPYSATDLFMAQADRAITLDTRPALRATRAAGSVPLYFRTDTHWNSFGALTAFQLLTSELARRDPQLHRLAPADLALGAPVPRHGGDLARFLRLDGVIEEPVRRLNLTKNIPTEQRDFFSDTLLASGPNVEVEAPKRALRVHSPQALNQRRVLWLRDSFGLAMSPYMAATFSDVVQVHYLNTDPALVARLVKEFRPDFVVLSVVERDAMDGHFMHGPP